MFPYIFLAHSCTVFFGNFIAVLPLVSIWKWYVYTKENFKLSSSLSFRVLFILIISLIHVLVSAPTLKLLCCLNEISCGVCPIRSLIRPRLFSRCFDSNLCYIYTSVANLRLEVDKNGAFLQQDYSTGTSLCRVTRGICEIEGEGT